MSNELDAKLQIGRLLSSVCDNILIFHEGEYVYIDLAGALTALDDEILLEDTLDAEVIGE